MKRFQNILMAVAASALAVVSCAKEEVAPETTVSEDKVYEYLFTLGEGDTKATLEEGNVVTWQTGDYLGVVCKHGTSYSWANNNTRSAITPSSGDTPAILNVTSHYALESGDGVYCFFPFKDGSEFKTENITFSIPTKQSNSINEMPMASTPYTVSGEISADTPTPVGSIDMLMLGSIARFKIYSSVEEYRSETVQSVTLTTDQAIAGSFTKNISTIDPKTASTLTISGYNEKSITETEITGTIGSKSEEAILADVVVAPGTYTGKVVVRTDKASYEYSLGTNGKTFERAHIKPLALDLGKEGARSEQKYFRKVTTDHDNFSGTYLVVYSEGNISKAFKGSSSNGDCIDVTIAADAIAATDALLNDVVKIVKESDKYYLLNAAEKYLYMSGTTSTIGTSEDPQEVTIAFDSQMKISSNTGTLKCKDGEKIKFYTGNYSFVDYYVLDGTEIPNDPNIVSLAVSDVNVPSTTKNVEVEIHCNKDWKAVATSDLLADGEISIEGTSATTSFTVPFKETNTDVKNDKVVTVTVSAGEGKYYVEKTVKVTQNAPQPKLELESKTGSATKDAGSTTFNVIGANFEWSVLGITVDDIASVEGYSAVKTPGEGNLGSVTITYPENSTDKPKKIIVTIGDQEIKTATYTLTQAAGQTASVLYELVTEVNNLAAGDEIMLGCSSKNVAAGALYSNNQYFTKVDATFSGNTISSANAAVLKLGGNSTDGWTLFAGTTQIGWSGTNLSTASTANMTWTISIESSGNAKIKESTSESNYIQYNSSSPRFKPYGGTQNDIEIYKKADSRTSQTISYSKETGSIDLYTKEKDLPTLNKAGVKTTVSFESSNTKVATIDAATGEITAVGVGETTITAKAAGDNTYKPAEASFELEVTNSAPVITILKETVDISSDAGTSLTISDAYSLENVEDSGIDVSWTGNITSATILNGTVTYAINENTSTETPYNSTITLKVKEKDTISGTITVTQAKKGGPVGPAAGAIIWKETWGSKTGAISDYDFSGTTTYSNSTTGLSYSVDNTNDKLESTTAGSITSNNCFFYKSAASSLTMSGIKLEGAKKLTLTFTTNGTNFAVYYKVDSGKETSLCTSCTKGTDNSCTFEVSGDVITLRFNKTGTSANNRLDDIVLKVAEN